MNFHDKDARYALNALSTDARTGLSGKALSASRLKYGTNEITQKKKRGFFSKVFSALKEPMLVILLFGFAITFGANLGKYLKTGEGDFAECFGILAAVVLSVAITLIMEGSSEKAFASLNKIMDNVAVRVVREGKVAVIPKSEVAVGDIMLIESGDKIVADGRLLESNSLSVDESALTGESAASRKDAGAVLNASTPIAERINCAYSGTFVTGGSGKMVVTAIGDGTEMGGIAGELSGDKGENTPLQNKLSRLGKIITAIGACCAIAVFLLSVIRKAVTTGVTFSDVRELFIQCIILIVAAVPEGLPTIVAVSLALNMIKLAKENALIKKMTATETSGAVSVICTDKTGTVTENLMRVKTICLSEFCVAPERLAEEAVRQNFILNSTADVNVKNGKRVRFGSGTECALIEAYERSGARLDYKEYRKKFAVVGREPFDGEKKYMTTTIETGSGKRKLIKGAPESVLPQCDLTAAQREKLARDMNEHQRKARRVLCFAHLDGDGGLYSFDGFAAIEDPIRKEVYKAVSDCKRAGISIKILTGDNMATALAIAKELKIAKDEAGVVNASDIEKLDDAALMRILPKITVIARSTPKVKLRVVRALKKMGEVVAVTGDGINDAPAIKHADVGIAMGISGSEITKEAADVVLLDDSFATVVKAISFGRNVYRNLQRFILFQLSVNFSALLFITVSAVLGLPSPFNTFQLLWINVIMDGPPALTLGLENAGDALMNLKPVRRDESIVGVKMMLRIAFNGVFMGGLVILQYAFNFLGAAESERGSAVFTLFVLCQLFNAFNSRELGSESILKGAGKNKVMIAAFAAVFAIQFCIVQFVPSLFGISPMSGALWLKTLICASAIVAVSEILKLLYRLNGKVEREQNARKRGAKAKLGRKSV